MFVFIWWFELVLWMLSRGRSCPTSPGHEIDVYPTDDSVCNRFCSNTNLWWRCYRIFLSRLEHPVWNRVVTRNRSASSVRNRILNWYQSRGTDLNDLTVVWINHSSFFMFLDVKFRFWLKGWNPRNPRFLIEPEIMWFLHVFVNSRVRFSFPHLSEQVSSSNSKD